MCKLCIFLVHSNNPEAFSKTIESLTQATAFEEARLVIIFDRMMYELDIPVLQAVENLPEQNVKCLYNVSADTFVQQASAEIPDDGFCFFMQEGDEIDPDYLIYIRYFFEDNITQCNVLLTPVVNPDDRQLPDNFIDLPYNGIRVLDDLNSESLPHSVKGVVLSDRVFKEILDGSYEINQHNKMEIFYKVMLKSIMQDKCYGIINAVSYISDTKDEDCVSAKILNELAEYGSELYKELPLYLVDFMREYVDRQWDITPENFDQNIFMLRPYLPFIFSEADDYQFSLSITDIRNHYTNVEIRGTYTRLRWEDETEVNISSTDNVIISYEEELGDANRWEQEINFKILAEPKDDNVVLQFGIHTTEGVSILETIDFGNMEEGTNRINNYTAICENSNVYIKKFSPRVCYEASCIIPVYNGEEYLKEALDSVIAQSISFFANIQILLINNGSTDSTESICLEYKDKYPYNISYFYLEEANVSKARNYGLQHAMGKYISFLDADDKLPPDYMAAGISYIKANEQNIDMVAFPIEYFGKRENLPKPLLNFRFKETRLVDVLKDPNYLQFSVCSALVKRSVACKLKFNEDLRYSEDAEFIHKVISNKMQYGVIKKPNYLYRVEDNSSATQSKENQIDWYMRNTILGKALIDHSLETHGHVTDYTQNLIIHELLDNLVYEIPEEIAKNIDKPSIMNSIAESLKHVEDDVIKSSDTLEYWFKCFLLKLKHDGVKLQKRGAMLEFYIGDTSFETLKPKVNITLVKEKNNSLYISGFYNMASYEEIELVAQYNGQVYSATVTENRHKNIYFLGEAVHKASVFDFEIPFIAEGNVYFSVQVKGKEDYPVELVFPGTSDNGKVMPFFVSKNILIVSELQANHIKLEYINRERLGELINNVSKAFNQPEFAGDRSLLTEYLSMYPLMSKSRMWLFMDMPKVANGNAEELFNFCAKIQDGIEKVFVIDKNTMDGIRLEEVGTVVQYGSNMHKLLYLYAEKIIVSNVLDGSYNPFAKNDFYSIYNGIAKAELIYLPNEPQQGDMSARLNKFTRNIDLFATVSESERDCILNSAYGYGDNVVQVIGLPKYDRLISEEQKKIIFMPSYREKLYVGENAFNFDFANSEYCQKISELLCDERLLEVLMENEYEMCFVPHEKTYLHLADFDMYENVNVVSPDFSRVELAISGTLLITDWMPTIEFAYMKKPIIYYNFAEGEAAKRPTSDTEFGETISDNEMLVDRIIEYINNGCIMPDEYVSRVNEYFKYVGTENCNRIYTLLKDSGVV